MKILKFVFLSLFMTSLFFMISVLFLPTITVYSNQNVFMKELNCNYIAIYESKTNLECEFKLLNSIYSIYNKEEKVKTDIVMQNKNKSIFGEIVLEVNEVAVSSNFLKNGFKIGDLISVKSPKNEDVIYFRIADVIRHCYGITNEVLDDNKGLIIFGYNENILNYYVSNIAFINNEDLSLHDVKLSKFMSVNKIIENNNSKITPLIICETTIKIFMCFIYCFIFEIIFKSEIRRYIVNGRSIANIIRTVYFKFFAPLFAGILLAVVLSMCYAYWYSSYIPIFIILFLIVIPLIFIIMFIDLKRKIRRN